MVKPALRIPVETKRDYGFISYSPLGAFVAGLKSAVTKGIGGLQANTGTAIWQRNYFEHIIRNDESLARTRQYIVDNPVRWEFDRENPFATRLEAKDSWRNGR